MLHVDGSSCLLSRFRIFAVGKIEDAFPYKFGYTVNEVQKKKGYGNIEGRIGKFANLVFEAEDIEATEENRHVRQSSRFIGCPSCRTGGV